MGLLWDTFLPVFFLSTGGSLCFVVQLFSERSVYPAPCPLPRHSPRSRAPIRPASSSESFWPVAGQRPHQTVPVVTPPDGSVSTISCTTTGPSCTPTRCMRSTGCPAGYTVDSGYETLINRFFGDVAADSGKTTNVYYSDTQYSDRTGQDRLRVELRGLVRRHQRAARQWLQRHLHISVRLGCAVPGGDQQGRQANGWVPNSSTEFFMFTAKGIGSCSGSSCAFSQYCAYHSWIGSRLDRDALRQHALRRHRAVGV